jgi:hypothetical protein
MDVRAPQILVNGSGEHEDSLTVSAAPADSRALLYILSEMVPPTHLRSRHTDGRHKNHSITVCLCAGLAYPRPEYRVPDVDRHAA